MPPHSHFHFHVEGPHHTGANTDADHILAAAVKHLTAAGHKVHIAHMHHEDGVHPPASLLDHPATR